MHLVGNPVIRIFVISLSFIESSRGGPEEFIEFRGSQDRISRTVKKGSAEKLDTPASEGSGGKITVSIVGARNLSSQGLESTEELYSYSSELDEHGYGDAREEPQQYLSCYNCSYFQGSEPPGLKSIPACESDPGEDLITVIPATGLNGDRGYCVIAIPKDGTKSIIRFTVLDVPHLAGTCKSLDISLVCYCDTNKCNGPFPHSRLDEAGRVSEEESRERGFLNGTLPTSRANSSYYSVFWTVIATSLSTRVL